VSSSASRAGLIGLAVVLPLLVAGCSSGSPEPAGTAVPAGEGAIELPVEASLPTTTTPSATDPVADLEVDDQVGNGTEVAVTSVLLSREPALLVITDMTGQVLGVKQVSTRSQPTQVRLQTPVTVSQELDAALYLDNGNGTFNPAKDIPMLDEENEPVSEDFDYVVQ